MRIIKKIIKSYEKVAHQKDMIGYYHIRLPK